MSQPGDSQEETGGTTKQLARHLDVSSTRMVQVLGLLRLDPEVIEQVISLGDAIEVPGVTERALRPLTKTPTEVQRARAAAWLRGVRHQFAYSEPLPAGPWRSLDVLFSRAV